jgi:phosphopantetheinyl transferase
MPLLYQQNINEHIIWALWRMDEPIDFFALEGYEASRISHPQKRKQHLAGRYVLKMLLPDLDVKTISVAENKKPFITGSGIDFSITHSDNLVGVIVGRGRRVGMDIEFANQRVLDLSHKFMTTADFSTFYNDDFSDQEKATIAWTMKESAFKLNGIPGVDFKGDLRLIAVEKKEDGWHAKLQSIVNGESNTMIANGMEMDGYQICLMY